MSRYPLRADDEKYEVTVGYDDPLDTYFAIVQDVPASRESEEDVLVLWTGTTPGMIRRVSELVAIVQPYAIVPDDVLAGLEADRHARRAPTDHQRGTFKMLTGEELP